MNAWESSHLPALMPNDRRAAELSEMQRIQTEIMRQVQQDCAARRQKVQQFSVKLNFLSIDTSRKIAKLSQQLSFDEQSIDDIEPSLLRINAPRLAKLRQTMDALGKKFDERISRRVREAVQPITDGIRASQEQLNEISASIPQTLDSFDEQVRVLTPRSHGRPAAGRGPDFRPRVDAVAKKIAELRAEVDRMCQAPEPDDGLAQKVEDARKALDGPVLVLLEETMKAASDQLRPKIDALSTELTRKVTQADSDLGDATPENSEADDEIDQKLEDLSKRLLDSDDLVERQKATLEERMEKLEESLTALEQHIETTASEVTGPPRKGKPDAAKELNAEAQLLRPIVAEYLKTRQTEWATFQETNKRAQTLIDTEIAKAEAGLSSDKHIPERLAAVERRTKWCLDRITVWQVEDAKKEELQVANEATWKRLEQLEAELIRTERTIAPHDQKGAPDFPESVVKQFDKVSQPCPAPADGPAPLGAVTFPRRFKWTYTRNEAAANDFPQLPP